MQSWHSEASAPVAAIPSGLFWGLSSSGASLIPASAVFGVWSLVACLVCDRRFETIANVNTASVAHSQPWSLSKGVQFLNCNAWRNEKASTIQPPLPLMLLVGVRQRAVVPASSQETQIMSARTKTTFPTAPEQQVDFLLGLKGHRKQVVP